MLNWGVSQQLNPFTKLIPALDDNAGARHGVIHPLKRKKGGFIGEKQLNLLREIWTRPNHGEEKVQFLALATLQTFWRLNYEAKQSSLSSKFVLEQLNFDVRECVCVDKAGLFEADLFSLTRTRCGQKHCLLSVHLWHDQRVGDGQKGSLRPSLLLHWDMTSLALAWPSSVPVQIEAIWQVRQIFHLPGTSSHHKSTFKDWNTNKIKHKDLKAWLVKVWEVFEDVGGFQAVLAGLRRALMYCTVLTDWLVHFELQTNRPT